MDQLDFGDFAVWWGKLGRCYSIKGVRKWLYGCTVQERSMKERDWVEEKDNKVCLICRQLELLWFPFVESEIWNLVCNLCFLLLVSSAYRGLNDTKSERNMINFYFSQNWIPLTAVSSLWDLQKGKTEKQRKNVIKQNALLSLPAKRL